MINKKLLVIVFLIGFILFTGYFAYSLFYYSTLEITIEGEHNPTKSTVMVGKQVFFPTGKDGRLYIAKVRPGAKTILYSSYNNSTEETVEVSLNSTKNVVLIPTANSAESVANKLIEAATDENISYASYFNGSEDWLVAKITSSDNTQPSKFNLYTYSKYEMKWILAISDTKITTNDNKLSNAPKSLLQYIDTEAGD